MLDKKQLLLDAALKLFVENGFHGTPTSKIAKEAGVANGTLFHYFSSKEDLILALYVSIKKKMGVYIAENATMGGSLKHTLQSHFIASLYWALDNQLEFRFKEQFSHSPYQHLLKSEALNETMKPYTEMLEKGIAAKIIKPLPADLIFTLIGSHSFGLNQYIQQHQFSKAKQHELIGETFDLLWDMIT